MNKPYIKQYNADGTISNPIVGSYLNEHPNRRQRRYKGPRAFNNRAKNSVHVYVDISSKTVRLKKLIGVVQDVQIKGTNKIRRILSYVQSKIKK